MKYGYVLSYVTTNIELINNLVSILNSNVRYWLLTAIKRCQNDGSFTPESRHHKLGELIFRQRQLNSTATTPASRTAQVLLNLWHLIAAAILLN